MRRKIASTFVTVSLITVLVGCPSAQPPSVVKDVKEWTIMVYMSGGSGGLDANKEARYNIFQMKEVGSTNGFNIIVQFDTGTDNTPTKRYKLTRLDGSKNIEELVNSIDSESLSKDLKEPFEKIQSLPLTPDQAAIQEAIKNLIDANVKVGTEPPQPLRIVLKKVLVTERAEDSFYKGLGLNLGRQTLADDPTMLDIEGNRERLAKKPAKIKPYLLECLLEQDKVKQIGETNVGNPKYLRDFIQFGIDHYPARHKMVIIWSHSEGFSIVSEVKAPPSPELEYLTISQLVEVFQDLKVPSLPPSHEDNSRIKIDILGFSECTMGLIENFYKLRNSAEIGIATEGGTDTRRGWPYEIILKNLAQKPEMGPPDLAGMIVDEYGKYQKEKVNQCFNEIKDPLVANLKCESDLSALYISRVRDVIEPLEKLTQLLINLPPTDKLPIDARHLCQSYASNWVDLSEFCQVLKHAQTAKDLVQAKIIDDLCDEIIAAIHKMVIRPLSLGVCVPSSGLAIYFPEQCVSVPQLYSCDLEIKEIQWIKFLNNYRNLRDEFHLCQIIAPKESCSESK